MICRLIFLSILIQEEWVVCRIFEKTAAVKKPQQTASSPQSLDSPNCDTNMMMNEFGDFDHLPNLNNNVANSSTQLMNNSNINNNILYNTDLNNMSNNITSWNAACEAASSLLPSLSWPSSSLLNSNLSINSLLLKALQLRSYQPRESVTSTSMDNTAFMPQGLMPAYGNDQLFSSNLAASTSTTRALDNSVHQEDQPFNLDSVW